MDVREKLVELINDCRVMEGYGMDLVERQADYLISNGVTMDVREKTTGLNYEAEYNRLKEKMAKQNEENTYLLEELKEKEGELLYHRGFKAACELIFGRRYEHEC